MTEFLEYLTNFDYDPEELVIILLVLINLVLSVILYRTRLNRNEYKVDIKFTEEEDDENDLHP